MIKDKWIGILADLRELSNLLMPRLYFPPSQAGTHIDNLFVFADASTKAYGTIVYLNSGNHISLAMLKNHVAPTRTVTLPRLELMAAVTANRLTEFVCFSIPHDKQQVRVHFLTDSQIVLHWVHKGTLIESKRSVKPSLQPLGHSHPQMIIQQISLQEDYLLIS